MTQSPRGNEAPTLRVEFEPRMCGQYVANLTVGCSFACLYCPFSDLHARREGVSRPTVVDLSAVEEFSAPRSVFLSSASDAFAPQAAPRTHALLAQWLPRGTVVGIATKGVIPERTLDLLAHFHTQIEGVSVGIASLDEHRNRIVEPGCPAAVERLGNIDRLATRGITVALRMDPLFPTLDDDPAALRMLVGEGAARGARMLTATYVFAWGRYLRRLRHEALLAESCRHLTERAPMEGGTAFSVPLTRKMETYARLAELARTYGLEFNTCGCKDLRLQGNVSFATRCRNATFLAASGASGPSCGDRRCDGGGEQRAAPS